MTKLLLRLAFLPLVFGTVHADESLDYRNANRVNTPQADPDLVNSNYYTWADNEEFQSF